MGNLICLYLYSIERTQWHDTKKNKEGILEGRLKEIIILIWKWLKRKMMSFDYSLNLLNGSHILGCALVQNLYAKDVCLLVCWLDYVCFVAVELTILSWHVKGRWYKFVITIDPRFRSNQLVHHDSQFQFWCTCVCVMVWCLF